MAQRRQVNRELSPMGSGSPPTSTAHGGSGLSPMPQQSPRGARSSSLDTQFTTPSPLAKQFDTASGERFLSRSGGADIKSEDKQFHMLPADPRVWAVASGGTIQREHDALKLVEQHGGTTVRAGEAETVSHDGRTTQAYPMRWIPGAISSKSQNKKFIAALQEHKDAPELHESMQELHRVSQSVDVQDFQVLFDPATRRLVVNDPRSAKLLHGTNGPTAMQQRLGEWQQHLGRPPAQSSPAQSSPARAVQPSEAMQAHQNPREPSREDLAARAAWDRRELEFVPAHQLDALFEPAHRQGLLRRQPAQDRHGNWWNFAHHSEPEGRVYLQTIPPTRPGSSSTATPTTKDKRD